MMVSRNKRRVLAAAARMVSGAPTGARGARMGMITRGMAGLSLSPTPAQRERRRRQRANRRARIRTRLSNCNEGGLRGSGVVTDGAIASSAPGLSQAYMEQVPNENYEPSVPALVRRGGVEPALLRSLGSTAQGQMWALKALHPNGEEVTAGSGIPDHTNVPVVTPEFRCNYTITGTSGTEGNDDIDIIQLPVAELAFMYRRYTSGNQPEFYKDWQFVFYPSLKATQHIYSGIKLVDNVPTPFNADYVSTSLADYGRTRATYAGMTLHLDAPALADQGRIVAAQMPIEMRDGNFTGAYLVTNIPEPPGYVRNVNIEPTAFHVLPASFPLSESQLFQASPGAVVWEAREGVYIPLRFREPVHLFNADLTETFFGMAASNDSSIVAALMGKVAGLTDSVTYMLSVGVPVNFLTSVVCIRGIDKRANFNVKARIGLESLVEQANEVAPFQHASPVLDRTALDVVSQLSQASPMAYPANYNDFGSILSVIRQVLGNVVKPIGRFVGGLGLPVVSGIGTGVADVLEQLGMSPGRRSRRRAFAR